MDKNQGKRSRVKPFKKMLTEKKVETEAKLSLDFLEHFLMEKFTNLRIISEGLVHELNSKLTLVFQSISFPYFQFKKTSVEFGIEDVTLAESEVIKEDLNDDTIQPEEEVNEEALKQEMIQTIVEETGFAEEEVSREFENFVTKYPELEVSKEVFLEANKELVLGENLFNVFDTNNSNSLNFYEFMQVRVASNTIRIFAKARNYPPLCIPCKVM